MIKVAIVILNWNGEAFLKKFLPTVVSHSKHEGVIVVVADNGSTDNSVALLANSFPSVQTIRLDRNYGFAGGYNRALSQVDADYYLLLNSDVEVPEGWLQPLIAFLDEHPHAGACMPKILDYNRPGYFEYAGAAGGFIDWLGYPFCRGRILSEIEADTGQYDSTTQVFWAGGASMFIRSKAYWEAGGLDDDFFAHMEEIDLCWRLNNLGYTVWCVPASRVYHVGGGTLPNSNPRKLYLNYRNSLYMLYKNLPTGARIATLGLRLSLDWASLFIYLVTFRFAYANAVLGAHYHFCRAIYPLGLKRKKLSGKKYPSTIFNRMILIEFFVRKRRKFSQLGFFTA
jgi:GT2 family glycosyltransferase